MHEKSKINRQNKDHKKTDPIKSTDIEGGIRSFTPPPSRINPIPVQSKKNPLQMKQSPDAIQAKKEEEKPAQFKKDEDEKTAQFKKDKDEKPAQINAVSGNKLPEDVQSKMENSFGADFSGVNIHANDNSATEMGALAYTQGKDIHFAPGQFNPQSQSGQELLGHELTHVVQQSQGRVQSTTQQKGLGVNEDASLEKEADVQGRKAAQGKETSMVNTTATADNQIQKKAIQLKRLLPAASGVQIEIDSGAVIDSFSKLWGQRPEGYRSAWQFDTPDNFTDHPDLPGLVRNVCGGSYFAGQNYWHSGWLDDGDTDFAWAGDCDVKAEISVYVDNEVVVQKGNTDFKSGSEHTTSDTRSTETTYSGKVTGEAGSDKAKAGAEGGVEYKEGRQNNDSNKGNLESSVNLPNKVTKGDVFMELRLSFKPSISGLTIGPKTVSLYSPKVGKAFINTVAY